MRLRLSGAGLQRAQESYRQTFISQEELAREARVNRSSIHRFFKQEAQNFDTFDRICSALNLVAGEVSDEINSFNDSSAGHRRSSMDSIEDMVDQVREQTREKIQHDSGTVPLWGYNPGKSMAEMFIDISLIPNPQSVDDRIADEQSLIADQDPDTFGRLGYQPIAQPMAGQLAAQNYTRMVVYGKPGSGKTTYLRWLALQCINGALLPDLVPIFISFEEFLEDDYRTHLKSHILEHFAMAQVEDTEVVVDRLLVDGKLLVLLDGFDGLPESSRRIVQSQLRELISQFRKCRFIISCRPPVRIHHLIGFETVEIAEFRQPQIKAFAKRWFELIAGDNDQSDRFMERLRRHRAISELAKTPLLLPMLCNVFAREGEFPANRISLYRKGFDILFEEWNETRYRQANNPNLYSQLPTKAKKALLSVIATDFFRRGKVLFHRNEIEDIVEHFFQDVVKVESFAIDPTDILEAIELQHGLVVRRAANYFSFSHLTFQEYLTAVYLVSKREYPIVYEQMLDDRWKFVIEIIAELLQTETVDDFLIHLKESLDNLIQHQPKLRGFMEWLNQFVGGSSELINISQPYKNTLLRATYFVFSIEDVGKISGFSNLTRRRALEFPDYYSATSLLSSQILDIHGLLFRIFHAKPTEHSLFFGSLNKMTRLVDAIESLKMRASLEAWSFQVDQQLSNYTSQAEWWYSRHGLWKDRVRQFMNQHFQLKCDWNFTESEKTILRQYYEGTKLLAECLNLSNTSKENYHRVANSLLKIGF